VGKRSVKDNKNIFQLSRENARLTRDAAAEKLGFISARRIETIEGSALLAHPDEVLPLADCYGDPLLCNRYCSGICPLGRETIAEISPKSLQEITVEMLASLNRLSGMKDRLIEIAENGTVDNDEQPDFDLICDNLAKMSLTIDTLKLWAESQKSK